MSLRNFKFPSRSGHGKNKQDDGNDGSDTEDWAKILNLSPEQPGPSQDDNDGDTKDDNELEEKDDNELGGKDDNELEGKDDNEVKGKDDNDNTDSEDDSHEPPDTQDMFEDTNAEVSEPETEEPKPGDPVVIVHLKPGTLGEWKLASLKHTLKAFHPDRFDRHKVGEMSYSERTRPYTVVADIFHKDGITVSEVVLENVYVFGRCRDGNSILINC